MNETSSHKQPHPDFDGHLETSFKEMTPEQRLNYAWQGTLLLHWARQARIDSGRALPEDLQREQDTG